MPPDFRGIFRTDPLARALYSEGAGIARAVPAAVAVPRDEEDVAALVRWAAESGTALIPRGSGSGMAGGAVGDGVVMDLSRLDAIEPVDERRRRIWVGAGALCGVVSERARHHGLRFPVDPSSGAFCTVGGMVSTNAAGAHSLRFGATRAWVQATDCVFDDGSRAVLRRGEPAPTGVPAVRRFLEGADEAIRRGDGDGGATPAAVRKNSSGYALNEYRS
ncbi:MAG: FAD-binding oxidoreductase, partial [Gemmatimonadaceae bacterium]